MAREAIFIQPMEKIYIDCVSGIAVCALGHAHPKLVKTINAQSKKVWHVSNAFQIPEGEKLAKKIVPKNICRLRYV